MSKRKRGIICAYCGIAWGYDDESPTPELIKEACDHESICEKNPYTAQIRNLKRERDEAREQCGGIENIKLKLEIASVKTKLASVVSIARQGRYSAMDFVAVGKILDAMDDYLANPQHQWGETK